MESLQRLRKLSGLTQARLANLSQVDKARISLIETGQAKATPCEQERLMQELVRALAEHAADVAIARSTIAEPREAIGVNA
jgi:transcriptional regulator with XRE-family HTH domain